MEGSGIVGHERVLALLDAELAAPANAYLFVGVSGLGKATVARRFAAALLCPEAGRHEEPCRSCRRVVAATHPDLVLVEPEGRQSLGVDQARSTILRAARSPVEGRRKVLLFEEAEAMTEQAANALLKTLEEPTASSVFILVARAEEDLPPTVASRCRTVHFGRVAEEDLVAALIEREVDPERASAVALVAGGRPGLALTLVANPAVADFRAAWLSVPLQLEPAPGKAFALAEAMLATVEPLLVRSADDDDGPRRDRRLRRDRQALLVTGLETLASWYVDAASLQLGGPVRNRDVPVSVLGGVTPDRAVRAAELVLDAVTGVHANLRSQLLLADLFTELAGD